MKNRSIETKNTKLQHTEMKNNKNNSTEKEQWWKEAIVYQIYPKSFMDSNGDGIGDIKGIIQKLDYIYSLGVNVIWICPIYKSPMEDSGYDISDYYHIDPQFGTDEDMDDLIGKAKELGIKILMDLVINHTSDEHKWFQNALADPEGKYGDYYIFKEGTDGKAPNNWRSYFGGSAWEQIGNSNRYYLHAFSKKQPDLNWENETVREELYHMINYWLEKGLGGFRIDAISNIKKNYKDGVFEEDGEDGLSFIGNHILNQPGIEEYLRELKERTFKIHDSMTVAEANVPVDLLKQFIGEQGFFSMVFDFSYTDIDVPHTGEWFKQVNWSIKDLREHIFKSEIETQKIGWGATYLENHDQPRSPNKYLPEDQINYHSVTMLASLFMLLRGTPFIYQGQEIGMTNIHMETMEDYDDLVSHDQYQRALKDGVSKEQAFDTIYQRSRDNNRTPMQWDTRKNAGFTNGDNTWLKVNSNYKEINVEKQIMQEKSILNYYKSLIKLRTQDPYKHMVIYGEFIPYIIENDYIIAYERVDNEVSHNKILAIHNFQNKECSIPIGEEWKIIVLSNYEEPIIANNQYNLRPYESIVLSTII